MEWFYPEKNEFPKDLEAVLAYIQSSNEKLEWRGLVAVYFERATGWHRCELYDNKPVHVFAWTRISEKPSICP